MSEARATCDRHGGECYRHEMTWCNGMLLCHFCAALEPPCKGDSAGVSMASSSEGEAIMAKHIADEPVGYAIGVTQVRESADGEPLLQRESYDAQRQAQATLIRNLVREELLEQVKETSAKDELERLQEDAAYTRGWTDARAGADGFAFRDGLEIRNMALHAAIDHCLSVAPNADQVLKAAKIFEAYLSQKGEKPTDG